MLEGVEGTPGLAPYVPRLVAEWDLDAPGAAWRTVDSTCCFVDISGFTALSERLARRGRIGAEELTEVLNHVFSRMLGVAYDKGGSLLKFGGDALLLNFSGDDHAVLAAQAAVGMRAALREARTLPTSVGRVNLRMSVGLHSGDFHFFRVGRSHHELLVTGPAATTTTQMEQVADAGEIVVSPATAGRLPSGAVGEAKGEGRLLRWRRAEEGGPGPTPARPVAESVVAATVPAALRRRLADRGGEPEHRSACVAFVKFKGVDAMLSDAGPDDTAAALDRLVVVVQEAADDEAVTFLATDIDADGGKVILTAGVPVAQDDDEGRILRVARRIVEQELPLPVRVGVNSGHVFAGAIGSAFRRTFTVMGDTVNLAARLMAAAAPGEVLATAPVLDRARTQFATEALEPFMVKGKSEPVQAYRVGAGGGTKTASAGSLPFRGRDKELTILLHAAEWAVEGRGGVALVEAERGAGKTRLLNELLAVLPAGMRVLHFAGEPNGDAVPYLPLQSALRDLLGVTAPDRRQAGIELVGTLGTADPSLVPFAPLLAPTVDAEMAPTPESEAVAPEFVRDRVGDLVVAALDAVCREPLLVVAEDSHWFDDATAAICLRLARAAAARRWLLCVARRPGTEGFVPPQPDPRLRLGPLPDDATRELVDMVTDAAPIRPRERDQLVSRAGGNPLFLEELLRIVRQSDIEALPESLDAVAMREIDALPATPRRVLRLASVLGGSFERSLLAELLAGEGVDAGPDLTDGLEAQLQPEGGDRLRFRHAVLREAAYESLPFRARLALHRATGEAIERRAGRDGSGRGADGDVASAMLSLHFLAAQDWERTWRYARAAARAARAAHAPGDAAVHLERAAVAGRKLDGVTGAELAEVLCDLGTALQITGEYERADDAYHRAAKVVVADPVGCAEIAERRAYLRSEYLGRPAAAMRQLHAAVALLDRARAGGTKAEQVRAVLLARQADVRMRQGRFTESIACALAAAAEAERAGELPALAQALSTRNVCLMLMGRPAETDGEQVLALYEELQDHVQIAVTLSNMAGVAFYACRWEEAADYVQRSAEESIRAGDLGVAALAQVNLAELRVNQGRFEEAVDLLVPARRVVESFGYRLIAACADMQLGRARAHLGDLDGGTALLRAAIAAFDEIGASREPVEGRGRLAEVLACAGDLDGARTALAEARRVARELDDDDPIALLLDRVQLMVAVASGARDEALTGLGPFVDRARGAGAAYDELVALTLLDRFDPDAASRVPDDPARAARLRRDLGVVSLPALVTGT